MLELIAGYSKKFEYELCKYTTSRHFIWIITPMQDNIYGFSKVRVLSSLRGQDRLVARNYGNRTF